MTTKHVPFDESIFSLSNVVCDENELVIHADRSVTTKENDKSIRWEGQNVQKKK